MLRKLTLVRHGESEWNACARIQGHCDSALSARGREQALRLRAVLRRSDYGAVYASDLLRAMQTAQLGLSIDPEDIRANPLLREICFGEWEGLTTPEVQERYPEAWATYTSDPGRNRPPGGETLEQLAARVDQMLHIWHTTHPGGSVVASTHGGFVRMAMMRVLDLAVNPWGILRVSNTGVTEIEFTADGAFLRRCNSTAHLVDALPPVEEIENAEQE